MPPHPKPSKRKKVHVDWSGFAVPKKAVKLTDPEYSKFKQGIIKARKGICARCGKKFPARCLTLEHITKRSILRLDIEKNIELLCINCAIEKREEEEHGKSS